MNIVSPLHTAPSPSCTPEEFKEGMRHLIGGVTIICTRHEGKSYGMTATAVCSVAAEPPLLLVCLNEKGVTGNAVVKSGVFSVNLIEKQQQELARRFSQHVYEGDRFDHGAWEPGVGGVPVLVDSPASFECRLIHKMKAGSHYVIIGQVEKVSTCSTLDPLGYVKGEFGSLKRMGSL
ncbi:MAG: hypothetical protein ABS76_29530 [Pelagibacterium sp. SCN 64-44]|nr:MAG: hypothetical protein ABS76_29530 [Pelagibacterium sp. SCN 64-44]